MDRKDLFFSLLGEELLKEDFKYHKSLPGFSKKENGNECRIRYSLWEYFYQVEATFEIFIGEVEKIKKKAWGKLYSKFCSVGSVKSDLIPNKGAGFVKTDTEESVRLAVQSEVQFYQNFAKNYFHQYLDYDFLDQKLNATPGEELHLAHNRIHTSFLAIIVAKLVGNPQLDNLFAYYREIVVNFNDAYTEDYDLLVKYLQNM